MSSEKNHPFSFAARVSELVARMVDQMAILPTMPKKTRKQLTMGTYTFINQHNNTAPSSELSESQHSMMAGMNTITSSDSAVLCVRDLKGRSKNNNKVRMNGVQ